MPKKWIWIGVAVLLVLALVVMGLLIFLPKKDVPAAPQTQQQVQQEQAAPKRYQILDCQTVGSWARDRWADSKIGPKMSYDEYIGTYWNPQAPGNYKGEPGIVYLLDGVYDITDFTAYFANREYFFQLYISSDCQEFTQIFEVNKENMASVYNKDYRCQITGLDGKNVAYLKIVFTGSNSSDNNSYISLRHVQFGGTWLKEGPASIPIQREETEKKKSIIADYLINGSWVRDREGDSTIGPKVSFDGNDFTVWNPQANGKYQGNPGITYMLNGYYDLTGLRVITDKREYYFQIYTSNDGYEFDLLADITSANYTQYYDGFTCSLENLDVKDVGYVKLVFTGSNSIDNNTYISLGEVEPTGKRLDKAAPTEIPDIEPKVGNTIIAKHRISGSWIRDREDMASLSAAKSYDEDIYSYWNPQANGGYAGKPGIVYMLDGYYDVSELQLHFGNREYYFEVLVSEDGYKYTSVANVNRSNMSGYYKELICTIPNLSLKSVGYVKILFTGSNSSDNNTYVSLLETVVRGTKLDREAPTTIPDTDEKVDTTKISKHMIVGSWVRDREDTDSLAPYRAYDENLYSGWNPQANGGYAGKPGVIYMLNGYYDITGFQLTFDKRAYFFELYTSADGVNFDLAAKVTKENMASYYKNYVFTAKELGIKGAGFVKLVFTGSDSSDNNTYISLMEVGITGKRLSGNGPGKIPAQPEADKVEATIIKDHKVVGNWIRDREDTPSLAPDKSYDENLYSGWNPQANSGYAGKPGIVYMLDGYYDVTGFKLTFDKREYFVEIYTSADGISYDQAGKITAENMADHYNGYVCSLEGLDRKGVGYVKLVFTGSNSSDNNTYISLMEVEITGTRTGTGAPSQIPEEETPSQEENKIVSHKVIGQWVRDREGDSSIGPQSAYDGNPYSYWNPQADSGYQGEPGIIYMLDGYYDVTGITLTFDKREYFTEIYTSSDGVTYTLAAKITVDNYSDYYEGLVCGLTDLNLENVGYVKLVFTGSNSGDNNTYVSLMEVTVEGTRRGQDAPVEIPDIPAEEPDVTEPEATEPEGTEPEITEPTEPEVNGVTIVANQVVGSWANDRVGTSIGPERTYDGNLTTNWNPAVTGFTSEAEIVFTLDKAYDLNTLRITFGSRLHYITVSVSSDGEQFTELGTVNSGNAAEYYTDLVCELSQLTANNVQYIKVTFIGTQNGTTWINMMEIQAFGTETVQEPEEPTEPEVTEPEITEPEVTEPEVTEPEVTEPEVTEPEATEPETTEPEVTEPVEIAVTIVANQVVGSWANDRVGTSIGPERTYDGNLTTNWNPAVTGFNNEAAIVYTLDQTYDLTEITLTFGTRKHYIVVSVSADNETYTEVARITSVNAADYYEGLMCKVDGIAETSIQHIKITFIGTENGTTWINMMEITGEGIPNNPEQPEIPETEDTRPIVKAVIAVYEVIGAWVRDREGDSKIGPQQTFDADVTTIWNPQATNYRSGEGIIYTLDKEYDLEKIALTFGTRQYYFTLHVSSDGESYTQVAEVNSGNAASYYTELVCTVEALNQENIRYIKILFTGSANSTTYISLADVEITGRERIVE